MTPQEFLKAWLRVTLPDKSQWDVPLMAIARNRAEHYKSEYGGDVAKSLQKDTVPLFCEDENEVADWAANNMNWSDVEKYARRVKTKEPKVDYQEGWMNGAKKIVIEKE
jgi:hypothetical protein